MHENGQSSGWKADVRFAGRFAPVYPVAAQAIMPEYASEQEFGLRVTAFVTAHIPAYLLTCCELYRIRFIFFDFLSDGQFRKGMLYI